MIYLLTKAALSGALIVAIGELARRNNAVASLVHSLPLLSLLAVIWLFAETRDSALIARHLTGTFFFVLPTLPLFLVVPWLLRRDWAFWPALGAGVLLTVALYFLTARLLRAAGVNL